MRDSAAALADAPAPEPVARHSFRRSVLELGQTSTLYPGELAIHPHGETEQRFPLSAVRKVHLKFHRTKQRGYHQCRITLENGQTFFLQDLHWAGFAKFEDRGATYTPFVLALHQALLPYRDRVQFKSGSLASFLMALLMTPVIGGVLVFALLAQFWLAATGLAVVLFTVLSLLPSSRPRTYPPESPPEGLLPKVSRRGGRPGR